MRTSEEIERYYQEVFKEIMKKQFDQINKFIDVDLYKRRLLEKKHEEYLKKLAAAKALE